MLRRVWAGRESTPERAFGLYTGPAEPVEPNAHAPQGTFLRTLGWISAGAGALGLGLVVGREIRQRYKFHRRTPYDLYAHAGDYKKNDLEFGVGI